MPKKAKSFYIFDIFVMYRPPDLSKFLHSKVDAVFRNMLSKVNFLKTSDNCEFRSILQLFGFTQLIRTPTRTTNDTKSWIDIIASNNCASIKNTTIVPCGIADHELIGCVREFNHMKFPKKAITCRDYRSYDPAKLSEHLPEGDWNLICKCHDVSLSWRIFKDILSTVFKFTPVITKE